METVYFTTSNFIRHKGNMVDLTEYRRKLALAQETPAETEEVPAPPARAPRRRFALKSGMMLDCAASVALIVTALTFVIKIL